MNYCVRCKWIQSNFPGDPNDSDFQPIFDPGLQRISSISQSKIQALMKEIEEGVDIEEMTLSPNLFLRASLSTRPLCLVPLP
jgi:hypothetical protein